MDSQENMLSTNNSQTGNNDVQKENKSNFCSNCKTVLDDEQKFCPMCGTDQSNTKKIVCSSCGFELLSGQIFCPRCGARICDDFICDTNEIKNKSKFSAFKGKTKGKKVVIIVCFIILIALIAVIVVFNVKNRGVELDFEKLYDEYCSSTWAEVGSDGSYLYVDTNPFDEDDDGMAYPAAYTAIENINSALGLPDSFTRTMGETSALDGRQKETFDDIGIAVSWKYYPDYGLEVTYKKIQ